MSNATYIHGSLSDNKFSITDGTQRLGTQDLKSITISGDEVTVTCSDDLPGKTSYFHIAVNEYRGMQKFAAMAQGEGRYVANVPGLSEWVSENDEVTFKCLVGTLVDTEVDTPTIKKEVKVEKPKAKPKKKKEKIADDLPIVSEEVEKVEGIEKTEETEEKAKEAEEAIKEVKEEIREEKSSDG